MNFQISGYHNSPNKLFHYKFWGSESAKKAQDVNDLRWHLIDV